MTAARTDELGAFLEERGKVHGEYGEQARVTQNLKATVRDSVNWEKLSPSQRDAIEMNCLKLGRILSGNPDEPDHWLDIQGYARLAWERLKTEGSETAAAEDWRVKHSPESIARRRNLWNDAAKQAAGEAA